MSGRPFTGLEIGDTRSRDAATALATKGWQEQLRLGTYPRAAAAGTDGMVRRTVVSVIPTASCDADPEVAGSVLTDGAGERMKS